MKKFNPILTLALLFASSNFGLAQNVTMDELMTAKLTDEDLFLVSITATIKDCPGGGNYNWELNSYQTKFIDKENQVVDKPTAGLVDSATENDFDNWEIQHGLSLFNFIVLKKGERATAQLSRQYNFWGDFPPFGSGDKEPFKINQTFEVEVTEAISLRPVTIEKHGCYEIKYTKITDENFEETILPYLKVTVEKGLGYLNTAKISGFVDVPLSSQSDLGGYKYIEKFALMRRIPNPGCPLETDVEGERVLGIRTFNVK